MNDITVFGDSNAVGHGVTAGQDWPSLLATSIGVTKTMKAQSGHMAADQSWLLYSVSPVATMDYVLSIGTNDAQVYGNNSIKRDAYVNFMRAIAVWCGAPSRVIAKNMTLTGAWADTPVNSIGKKNTAAGSVATTIVNGRSVYVAYLLHNNPPSEGTFEVRVDGVLKRTVTLNGVYVGNTQVGQTYAPACVRIDGLSDGDHTVQVTITTVNTVHLEWVAGCGQPSKPRVIINNVVKRTATGYAGASNDANVALYGAAAFSMADELIADGLNVAKVDIATVFDPSIHLQADGIHYNPAGHIVVKDAVKAVVSPPPTFTPAEILYGSDGRFYAHSGAVTTPITN